MRSLIIAFSMYSRIPMPGTEWDEKGMKYSMCFFPAVGLVLGLCSLGLMWLFVKLGFQKSSTALVLASLPVLLTGGIHMDGYLDVTDAKNSWKPAEEKLKILKDPHIGAFACIYGIVYLLLAAAFFNELSLAEMGSMAACYVYSRILSGLSVVAFRKAKKDGMAADSARKASPVVKWILLGELAVCLAVMCLISPFYGVITAGLGLLCFLWYRRMAYRIFGGTTGDLAGYFLQICELLMLVGIVLGGKIVVWFS